MACASKRPKSFPLKGSLKQAAVMRQDIHWEVIPSPEPRISGTYEIDPPTVLGTLACGLGHRLLCIAKSTDAATARYGSEGRP